MTQVKLVLDEVKNVIDSFLFKVIDGKGNLFAEMKGALTQSLHTFCEDKILFSDKNLTFVNILHSELETGKVTFFVRCQLTELTRLQFNLSVCPNGEIEVTPNYSHA